MIDDLAARHRQPGRHYHTAQHVAAVLGALDDLAADLDIRARARVVAAAWFHDAVYDPREAGNEEASAQLAEAALTGAGVDPGPAVEVARLVRLTAGHRAPVGDHEAEALLDADLAVLGSEPTAYDAYRRAVRAEYGHLTEAEWAAGRRAVLQSFLDTPAIYSGERARARWEARARANLSAEAASLSSD